jgi:hypothetical protein
LQIPEVEKLAELAELEMNKRLQEYVNEVLRENERPAN